MKVSHYQTLYDSELVHWWYRVRREIVHKIIKEYVGKNKDLSILDVGCGTGALIKELERYGAVYGIDFSEEAVSYCRSRGIKNVEKSIVEKIPYPEDYFDVVLAMDVLEHIPDDRVGLREIYRVLKPGGLLVIFVPAFMFLWGTTDVISQHYRRYSQSEIVGKTKEANFSVVYSSYFNFFLFFPIYLSRSIVRLFKVNIESENNTGVGVFKSVLYWIFHSEVPVLFNGSFPFGVSCVVIARK